MKPSPKHFFFVQIYMANSDDKKIIKTVRNMFEIIQQQ